MRTYLLAAVAAVVLLATGVTGAHPQSSNDPSNRWMEVENRSKYIAVNIHIIPSSTRPSTRDCCWSRDLLEANEIRTRQSFHVHFDDGSRVCNFDIRVISAQGKEWNFDSINVCSVSKITLRNAPPQPSKDGTDRWMTVQNNSNFTARFIYFKPSSRPEQAWSFDLLGEDTIPRKVSADVHFDDGSGECTFDIRVIDSLLKDRPKEWKFQRVNVCSETKITLK